MASSSKKRQHTDREIELEKLKSGCKAICDLRGLLDKVAWQDNSLKELSMYLVDDMSQGIEAGLSYFSPSKSPTEQAKIKKVKTDGDEGCRRTSKSKMEQIGCKSTPNSEFTYKEHHTPAPVHSSPQPPAKAATSDLSKEVLLAFEHEEIPDGIQQECNDIEYTLTPFSNNGSAVFAPVRRYLPTPTSTNLDDLSDFIPSEYSYSQEIFASLGDNCSSDSNPMLTGQNTCLSSVHIVDLQERLCDDANIDELWQLVQSGIIQQNVVPPM